VLLKLFSLLVDINTSSSESVARNSFGYVLARQKNSRPLASNDPPSYDDPCSSSSETLNVHVKERHSATLVNVEDKR
jgi:hypothetical protein